MLNADQTLPQSAPKGAALLPPDPWLQIVMYQTFRLQL